jgi:protein-ribulosamine 3-kinase
MEMRLHCYIFRVSMCERLVMVIDRVELNTEFPKGFTLLSALPHGASFWARTARVNIQLLDGTCQSYFLKVAKNDLGRGMSQGEFEGMIALYEIAPDFVPQPIGWGTYKSDPDTHFYLADFIDMIEELPDLQRFCAQLAKMHKDSIQHSPDGKFGFHTTTH